MADFEQARGAASISAGFRERFDDEFFFQSALGLFQGETLAESVVKTAVEPRDDATGQVLGRQNVLFGQHHRPLDHIFQLTDVARPRMFHDEGHGRRGDGGNVFFQLAVLTLDEKPTKSRDILGPLSE